MMSGVKWAVNVCRLRKILDVISSVTKIKGGRRRRRKKKTIFNAWSSAASNNNTGVMAVLDITENLSTCAEHQGNAALEAFNTNTCLYRGLYWDRRKKKFYFTWSDIWKYECSRDWGRDLLLTMKYVSAVSRKEADSFFSVHCVSRFEWSYA